MAQSFPERGVRRKPVSTPDVPSLPENWLAALLPSTTTTPKPSFTGEIVAKKGIGKVCLIS